MTDDPVLPDWLDSTLAADAVGPAGAVLPWIRALSPERRVAGRVTTALTALDDNGVVRQIAAAGGHHGEILVVAGGAWSRTAMIGDLMARELLLAGIGGLITDGLVRDADEVRSLPLGVWCRGTTTVASRKDEPGSIDVPVSLGGVIVRPGDFVVADANGVVVWPAASRDHALARAEQRRAADAQRLEALESRLGATPSAPRTVADEAGR